MTPADLRVRPAVEADLPLAARLMKATQDAHVEAYPGRYRPMALEALEELLRQDLAKSQNLETDQGFVVVCRGEVALGYAIFEIMEAPGHPVLVPRKYGYLRQIDVDPSARGLGAGHRLIQHVRQACAEAGVDQLELDVWAFNEAARGFFESAGFERFATKMRSSLEDLRKPGTALRD